MMRALLRTLLIALPLAGLAYSWQSTRLSAAQGVEWDVAVTGYDPRDLLRGHYVRFRYVWPEGLGMNGMDDSFAASEICLEGPAPTIRLATRRRRDESKRACDGVARTGRTMGNTPMGHTMHGPATMVPIEGRIFVPQAQAPMMERQLTDPKQQAILRFRLKPDGEITPLRLSFQPKTDAINPYAAGPAAPVPPFILTPVDAPNCQGRKNSSPSHRRPCPSG